MKKIYIYAGLIALIPIIISMFGIYHEEIFYINHLYYLNDINNENISITLLLSFPCYFIVSGLSMFFVKQNDHDVFISISHEIFNHWLAFGIQYSVLNFLIFCSFYKNSNQLLKKILFYIYFIITFIFYILLLLQNFNMSESNYIVPIKNEKEIQIIKNKILANSYPDKKLAMGDYFNLYYFYRKNPIEENDFFKWLMLNIENENKKDETICYYLIGNQIDFYSESLTLKFKRYQNFLNLNDDELIYRVYFWIDKKRELQHTNDYIGRSCFDVHSYYNYSDTQLTKYKQKLIILLQENNYLEHSLAIEINSKNINTYEKYGLMGDKIISQKITEYYKTLNDEKNYVKWLWISAENGNKISEAELGTLLLSNSITEKELRVLHLEENEKNLRGQFWLSRSKEKLDKIE